MTDHVPPVEDEILPDVATVEESVIGACLLDQTAATYALDRVRPDHFESGELRSVLRAIQLVTSEGGIPDIVAVNNALADDHGGKWASLLARLVRDTPTAANQAYYTRCLLRNWLIRLQHEHASVIAANGISQAEIAALRLKELRAEEEVVAKTRPQQVAAQHSWDLADIAAEQDPPAVDQFVEQVFTRPSLNLVFGPPSAGKSWAVMSLLLDAVTLGGGQGFLGDPDLQVNSNADDVALWIFGSEDTATRVKRRLRCLWGPGDSPARGRFICATPPPNIVLNTPDGWRWLEDLIDQHKATLVALDTIASLTAGTLDVNKAEQVAPFMGKLLDLRSRKNLILFALHHTRKAAKDIQKGLVSHADSMLGAQTWRSLADGCLMLDANDGDTADVRVRLVKAKDIDNPIPSLRVTLVPGTGRFRPLEEEEEAPKREKRSNGGRHSVFTIDNILALRTEHPHGFVWNDLPRILGGKETTFSNHTVRLKKEFGDKGHAIVLGQARWLG